MRSHATLAVKLRSFSTIQFAPLSAGHTSLCRCLCCSNSSLLPIHSTLSSARRPSLFCLPIRAFSGDAHAEHSHGDFLDPATVEARVIAVLRNIEKLSAANITAQSTWQELGLDSLDEVEVVMQLEEEFMVDLYDPDAVQITSVKQAVEAFSNFPFAM